jgi:hypothetical protein
MDVLLLILTVRNDFMGDATSDDLVKRIYMQVRINPSS